ncbi:MAG: hypothetical protein AAF702_24475 [Chloroflexota bacterium]
MTGLSKKISLLAGSPVVLLCVVVSTLMSSVLGVVSPQPLLARSLWAKPIEQFEQNTSNEVDALDNLTSFGAVDNVDEELVYLDDEGTIRVLDTSPGNHGELTWSSPEDGFVDVAAGDFNIDGDYEIVGIKNSTNRGRIVIYDPVISDSESTPDGWFGDVPWRTLADIQTNNTLTLLAVGELDTFFPGDEILYGIELEDDESGIRVITADSQSPDGTGWRNDEPHIASDFAWRWDEVTVGNIDGESTDEVVLMGSQTISDVNTSLLHFYRVNTSSLEGKVPFAQQDRTSIRWRSAAVGEVKNLGSQEVVVIGEAVNNANDNIHIFNYTPSPSGGIMDYADGNDRDFVNPSPLVTFLADITGIVNNQRDEELFFLRSVPAGNTDAPRFFARNQGNDTTLNTNVFDLALDSDNGWQGGTGADVDSDGKDELVLIRDTKIRIYTEPDTPEDDGTLQADDFTLSTNGTHIIGANLDANGAQVPLRFDVTATRLENGLEVDSTGEIRIIIDSDNTIDFTASLVSPPVWVQSLSPLSGQSPAEVILTVDSTGLNTGRFTTVVRITTSEPFVQQEQYDIEVELNVVTSSFSVSPDAVNGVYFPCEPPFGIVRSFISVTSSENVAYNFLVLEEDVLSAAQLALNGPIVDISRSGNSLSLYDAYGNSSQVTLSEEVISAQLGAESPEAAEGTDPPRSAVPWISANANSTTTPGSIELIFEPQELFESGATSGRAKLLVLADKDVVMAPFNDRTVPIKFLCADSGIYLPLVQQ